MNVTINNVPGWECAAKVADKSVEEYVQFVLDMAVESYAKQFAVAEPQTLKEAAEIIAGIKEHHSAAADRCATLEAENQKLREQMESAKA